LNVHKLNSQSQLDSKFIFSPAPALGLFVSTPTRTAFGKSLFALVNRFGIPFPFIADASSFSPSFHETTTPIFLPSLLDALSPWAEKLASPFSVPSTHSPAASSEGRRCHLVQPSLHHRLRN
jgi:hypothetical protein